MLKVAFATDNRVDVNQHFGSARGFAIYALDAERGRLIEASEFAEEEMDGQEDDAPAAAGNPDSCKQTGSTPEGRHKLVARIDALAGCAAVYCLAAGASAVRQLLARGVQPVRLDEPAAIEALLAQLRRALKDGGVPWLDKALRRDAAADRFERMATEGWQE
jgi:nitrogen fixation protein NifX